MQTSDGLYPPGQRATHLLSRSSCQGHSFCMHFPVGPLSGIPSHTNSWQPDQRLDLRDRAGASLQMGHGTAKGRTIDLTISSLQMLKARYNGLTPFLSFKARTLTRLTRHLQEEAKLDMAQCSCSI